MKKILGLDLGTNSIGWAVINAETDAEGKEHLLGISHLGSRIIPMDAEQLGNFDKGNTVSQTADRTKYRGTRRLIERRLLRRERLLRVLSRMGFLPEHYAQKINRYGKFIDESEPKIAWAKDEEGWMQFLFQSSFNEMLSEFHAAGHSQRIPYDWTLYYLRKKALTQPIAKEELAWVLLNFNQKRGYNQTRAEIEEEKTTEVSEYMALKVLSVEDSGDRKGKDIWYNVHLEGNHLYRRASSQPLDWVGKVKDFIVTTKFNPDGTPKLKKDGSIDRSYRAPGENDWTLKKKKQEADINRSSLTVGAYIYETLLHNPQQKIKGSLVQTIEREYYKDELEAIVRAQTAFHPELQDRELYAACIEELYPVNDAYRNSIASRDFTYLLVDDILFYQRPLKSKKSLIDNCPYESHIGLDGETKKEKQYAVKCIAKSHPLFQEFRLWQFISNLRIYEKRNDVDVTAQFLPDMETRTELYRYLNNCKEIDQKGFLKALGLKGKEAEQYRWNYLEDKKYPCNETRALMLNGFSKANIDATRLTSEMELQLWHVLYSIDDRTQLRKALQTFANRNELPDEFVEVFTKSRPFDKEYGAYSAKAIGKLLPLMRCGSLWQWDTIDPVTKQRIQRIIDGEVDDNIDERTRKATLSLTSEEQYQGLPTWLACYIVYGRHSEAADVTRWESPEDIDKYLKAFRQHSLRNPVVEQVLMETLRVVRDIWKQEGQIDEIHVELGREMKNPADKRKQMSETNQRNEDTNLRIQALLTEFMNPEYEIDGVRPYSPSQQEILRIYEEGALGSTEVPDDIEEIRKKFRQTEVLKRPTQSEIKRYKLWLEQHYLSPYTAKPIPLSRLFTADYQIEHVIPQSRYFDDSFTNKVICEAAVNRLKSNMLGHEFIAKHGGEVVDLGEGRTATILEVSGYEDFVRRNYATNPPKMRRLLMDDIPEDFILRQMNDTRYISKLAKSLLSNIVRTDGEKEAMSKNVVVCTGGVTDQLKRDWGVNDVWNAIILPRFQRLNAIQNTTAFTSIVGNHEIPTMPLEYKRGFNKKRIDHRHHAMDAIIIACASRNIINYLSNLSGTAGCKLQREDLKHLLCHKHKTDDQGNYQWIIDKPWETFTQDVRVALESIVVSFKQNLRILNTASNRYVHYDAEGKKQLVKQTTGDHLAVRKSMHKDTVFADVNLRRTRQVNLKFALEHIPDIADRDLRKKLQAMKELGFDQKQMEKYFKEHTDEWRDIDLKKITIYYYAHDTENERYYATRKPLDTSFDKKKITQHITDTATQKILLAHLEAKGGNPEVAFSPDGIEEMNRNIVALNGGRKHQPIYKVRWYEQSASKFAVGQTGCKRKKFVEAADGTNLFYGIYETEVLDKKSGEMIKKRSYATVGLSTVVERMKQGLAPVPANADGVEPKYILSPGDLVYVPTVKERERAQIDILNIDYDRIYKFVSCVRDESHYVKASMAKIIVDKVEYQALNKVGRAFTGEMIREVCIPLQVDRLGNIIGIGKKQ